MKPNAPSHRMERINRLLQRRLAELIQSEIKEPLEVFSISHVQVSRDLSYASIHITTLSDDPEVQKKTVSLFNKYSTHLRRCFAKESTWRTFPALRFKYDEAFTRAQHLVELLDNIAAKHKPKESSE